MSAAMSSSQLPGSVCRATAYGYGRQSHRDQIDAAEGIPQQSVRTKAYFTAQLELLGVKWGGFIPDESAVSARTNPFMLRHPGKLLFDLLQPGDHFIVDKVDRLWRSVADFVDVRRMFEQRKVTLHICNLMGATSVQLGTPAGDFVMNIMVAGAQMESDQCSDRTRARFAGRRAEGRYPGSRTPLGCKLIGSIEKVGSQVVSDTRQFIWCPERRRFMGELVRLADEDGKNCSDIRGLLRTHFRELMGDRFFRDVIAVGD
jgi:DNA invertase Pin-like site-specific DNA recombinase